ncbi:hypothetical protein BDCR2A_01251 [Borrelia duttonii CR2A]|uniref:Uncharacterized protein n=1 Tax=Borrelia duttonii CR2A TaxID=1432657 RepID=W6TG28_9SPIR|nr:DUF261 domain-containing protein [Borrelia duttonii]ETZ17837.1 hypothetical protein BDCR2A_01251 [Borrelia duttonii CR2A]
MKLQQNDNRFLLEIRRRNCYFLSLHYYIASLTKNKFDFNDINNNYYQFVSLGYMKSNCYILNPCRILSFFGVKRGICFEDKYYKCLKDEFEISEVKIKNIVVSHFMATNNTEVLYDSLYLKDGGQEYLLKSKCVFKKYNLLHICIYC